MADILRVVARVPDLQAGLSVHLVETSPVLRARQAETLRHTGVDVCWHERLQDVPDGSLLLVANEFFDALPVRQFVRAGGDWRERVVGIGEDGTLAFGIGAGRLAEGPAAPDGSILEISAAREAVMAELAARIARHGAAALIVDYGHAETAPGDTLQAMRSHAFVDPLAEPGQADLTSHVDFGALRRAARAEGAAVHGPVTQGEFLLSLGLLERAGQLGAMADERQREAVRRDVERLAGPEQMGTLFKVLAVTMPGITPPPFPASGR
jgi:NADH dehydrogenase [ubiquinone] 1 alpha subcomplex assembly factor 7